jgi:hypothetical protein
MRHATIGTPSRHRARVVCTHKYVRSDKLPISTGSVPTIVRLGKTLHRRTHVAHGAAHERQQLRALACALPAGSETASHACA